MNREDLFDLYIEARILELHLQPRALLDDRIALLASKAYVRRRRRWRAYRAAFDLPPDAPDMRPTEDRNEDRLRHEFDPARITKL